MSHGQPLQEEDYAHLTSSCFPAGLDLPQLDVAARVKGRRA